MAGIYDKKLWKYHQGVIIYMCFAKSNYMYGKEKLLKYIWSSTRCWISIMITSLSFWARQRQANWQTNELEPERWCDDTRQKEKRKKKKKKTNRPVGKTIPMTRRKKSTLCRFWTLKDQEKHLQPKNGIGQAWQIRSDEQPGQWAAGGATVTPGKKWPLT